MPFTSVPVLHRRDFAGQAQLSCLRLEGEAGAVCVALAGELDIATVPRVDRVLRRAQADADLVVLDLRALWFMDCRGAHLVVAADRRARLAGGRLVVVRGPAETDWFFGLLDRERRLEVADQPPPDSACCEGPRSVAA